MSAVATKPRKSAPKLPGAPAPAVYKRPESTYCPAVGKTAAERLEILRSTLHAADEKIEAAYDAAERGTVLDTLLHLVAHNLLCTALHPVLRNEDEAGMPVTKADLDITYEALFPVLASLEGAIALSMESVISSTLVEAFQLLDWAQGECDGAGLGKLLPGFDQEAAFIRGRDLAIDMLEEGQRQYSLDTANGMRMLRPCTDDGRVPQQDAFVRQFLEQVANDPALVAGFDAVLSAALSEDPVYNPDGYRVPMAEFQAGKPGDDGTEPVEAEHARDAGAETAQHHPVKGPAEPNADESDPRTRIAEAVAVLHAAAHEHGCAEVWGVHSLAKLIERTLDSANSEDADDLQDVSNLLEQVLAVIEKVNDQALDCMLLHAGASLLITAKQLVDEKCEAVS